VISHPNPLESGGGGGDPEGEAAGRRQGLRLGSVGKKRREGGRKKKGPTAPGILSESRHAAWRD
jgi:hypothetical protein